MTVIEKINQMDWNQYKGLEYYRPEAVMISLKRLYHLTDENDNNDTYNMVLSSIGNNHSGTYYPVVENALPIIIDIAQSGQSEVSRNCALEILSDLCYCFEPEIGDCNEINIQMLEEFVYGSIVLFLQQEHEQTESNRNRKLRLELSEYIKEVNSDF